MCFDALLHNKTLKRGMIMFNCLLLFLLNIVYLLCNTYPKHIVEISNMYSVFSVIFNLLFYSILSLLIIISVDKNKMLFSNNIFSPVEKVFRRFRIKKILFLIICQIIIDVVLMSMSMLFDENALYLFDFSTVVQWIVFYFVSAKRENNIFLKKSVVVIMLSILMLFAISSVLNFVIIKNYDAIFDKYSTTSGIFATSIKNLDFIFQIKNFLLDTAIGFLIFTIHFLSNGIYRKKCKFSTKIIQVGTLIIFSFILICVKSILFPYSSFNGINISTSETKHNYPMDQFYASTQTIEISRKNIDYKNNVVFQVTKNRLFFNGQCIFEYVTNDNINANNYVKNGNVIVVNDCFEELDANGNVVLLYKDKVACYVYNNTPIVLYSEDKSNINDESLLIVHRTLIQKGCWNFYEQSVEYLKEHDPDFINPYIYRHSSGQFNSSEIAMFDKLQVKQSYIENIALNYDF